LRSKTGQVICPYAGICADICYADQGRLKLFSAKRVREKNLTLVNKLTPTQLRDAIIDDIINMRNVTHIRMHDSGDFFSKSYYRTWVNIAQDVKWITFYTYTKSIPFLDWDSHPDNLRIVQSMGGKRDSEIDICYPHAKVFPTLQERKRAGYSDGNKSDIPAVLGYKRIGLVYHGVRGLSEHEITRLRAA